MGTTLEIPEIDIELKELIRLLKAARDNSKNNSQTLITNLQSHDLDEVATRFDENDDHGKRHSYDVYSRALKLLHTDEAFLRYCQENSGLNIFECEEVLRWSSILHDLTRFLGYGNISHQTGGAKLALAMLNFLPAKMLTQICYCLREHDYFNPLINGKPMPESLKHPLADIFRLADKTSISPEEEISRWWKTGERHKTPFYNPTITEAERFHLENLREARVDQVSHYLVFFALQSGDFHHAFCQEEYASWARGKMKALDRLVEIAKKQFDSLGQPIKSQEIKEIVLKFAKQNRLVVAT